MKKEAIGINIPAFRQLFSDKLIDYGYRIPHADKLGYLEVFLTKTRTGIRIGIENKAYDKDINELLNFVEHLINKRLNLVIPHSFIARYESDYLINYSVFLKWFKTELFKTKENQKIVNDLIGFKNLKFKSLYDENEEKDDSAFSRWFILEEQKKIELFFNRSVTLDFLESFNETIEYYYKEDMLSVVSLEFFNNDNYRYLTLEYTNLIHFILMEPRIKQGI